LRAGCFALYSPFCLRVRIFPETRWRDHAQAQSGYARRHKNWRKPGESSLRVFSAPQHARPTILEWKTTAPHGLSFSELLDDSSDVLPLQAAFHQFSFSRCGK
jgi:hypothetical protein